MIEPGRIIVLNGAPRSGKSSLVEVIQADFPGAWMNLGVDVHAMQVTPPRFRPGIGLRPGPDRPEVAALVPTFYAALYDSIAAHSRLGLNVVADVGHHTATLAGRIILADCACRLVGLPVLFVGVRCSIETIMRRRAAGQPGRDGAYLTGSPEAPIPEPVQRWQDNVHHPNLYDLEVDTDILTPQVCAERIHAWLEAVRTAPSGFERLAEGANLI